MEKPINKNIISVIDKYINQHKTQIYNTLIILSSNVVNIGFKEFFSDRAKSVYDYQFLWNVQDIAQNSKKEFTC